MTDITLLAPILGALLLGTVLALWLRQRRRARRVASGHREPPSLVRLLRSSEELGEAVRRAAHFEEAVERGVANRRRHYAELLGGIPVRTAEQRVVQLEVWPLIEIEPHEQAR